MRLLVLLLVTMGCAQAAPAVDVAGSCPGCAAGGSTAAADGALLTTPLLDAWSVAARGPAMQRRQLLQNRNREALDKLRVLLSETQATEALYPGRRRRRRLLSGISKLAYATQCLYKPVQPLEEEEFGGGTLADEATATLDGVTVVAGATQGPEGGADADPRDKGVEAGAVAAASSAASTGDPSSSAASRRRAQAISTTSAPNAPPPPPSLPPSPPDAPTSQPFPPDSPESPEPPVMLPASRCYLNPAVIAHSGFPEPDTPIENMLVRAGFTSYQCMFENNKRRCGTYGHPPHDCQWQEEQGRCMVGPDFLLPRLIEYLHCRDDTTISPFWHRCYMIGVLTGDSDNCGQADSNWARCWWFEARSDEEQDVCGPDPNGGVADRHQYDELVAAMRNGTWEREWFGECPTADLAHTIQSACSYSTPDDCTADPSCSLHPDRPPEYGMCRLADQLLWDAIFGTGSELFNSIAVAMAECAAASDSLNSCMAAGSLAGEPGGPVKIDNSRFDPDLWFIEEVTSGSADAGRQSSLARTLLTVAPLVLMGLMLFVLLRPPS